LEKIILLNQRYGGDEIPEVGLEANGGME